MIPITTTHLFVHSTKPFDCADIQIPFEFDAENMKRCEEIIARYPPQYKKAAVMPILDIGQRQNKGWTSISVMNAVAKLLDMPKMRVYEVSCESSRIPGRKLMIRLQLSIPCTTESPSPQTSCNCAPLLHVCLVDVDPTPSWTRSPRNWVSSLENQQRTESSHYWRLNVSELAPMLPVSYESRGLSYS